MHRKAGLLLLMISTLIFGTSAWARTGDTQSPQSVLEIIDVQSLQHNPSPPDKLVPPGKPETKKLEKSKKKSRLGSFFSGFVDKATGFVKKAGTLAENINVIPHLFKFPSLGEKEKETLLALAKKKPQLAWTGEKPMSEAVNAHRTNTPEELSDALKGNYDWLECDVRNEGVFKTIFGYNYLRRPACSHDPQQQEGMLFEDWIKIAAASGRGIKIDFKQLAASNEVLKLLQQYQVPQEKIILNVGIGYGKNQTILDMRREFPRSIINLSPSFSIPKGGHYTAPHIQAMVTWAQAVGQPVMFPLKAEYVTKEIVQALKPYGKVAIWNDPATLSPANPAREIQKFKDWGCDGMIDIRTKAH